MSNMSLLGDKLAELQQGGISINRVGASLKSDSSDADCSPEIHLGALLNCSKMTELFNRHS